MEETRQHSPLKEGGRERARKRLRGFAIHLIGYFALVLVLVPINVVQMPDNPWILLPMLGWGTVLAFHAAYVMGLFDTFRRDEVYRYLVGFWLSQDHIGN